MKKRLGKGLLLMTILMLAVGLVGCSNDHVVESEDKKIRMTVPEDWQFNEALVQDASPLVASKESEKEGAAAVIVTPKGTFSKGKSFDEVTKELQKSFANEAEASDGKLKTLSEADIDGKKAKTYESKDDTGNYVISLIDGKDNYYMVFVGAEKEANYDQKAFQEIAESVEIEE